MFLNNSFGKTIDLLQRSMDVTLLRRSVIADNLANSNTPNFKRSVINFESELKRAFESEKPRGLKAKVTDKKHISFHHVQDYRDVAPKRVLDYMTQSKNNGNNVDLEEESMNALQNQLNYQLLVLVASEQFSQINSALR